MYREKWQCLIEAFIPNESESGLQRRVRSRLSRDSPLSPNRAHEQDKTIITYRLHKKSRVDELPNPDLENVSFL